MANPDPSWGAVRDRGPEPQASRLLEFEEQTAVGTLYLQALMRRQLRLSLTLAFIFVAYLFAQPLLSTWFPQWATVRVLGVPLPWLVLGVGSYPILIWLGSIYVRRAEEVDDEFTDLLS